jgi:hypothetical protein
MATRYSKIEPAQKDFIARQHVFFTASAAAGTRINLSPRSTDYFRVLGPNRVVYLDRTGSGNETAAHIRADGRLTIMMCAFDGPPRILRLYGKGRVINRESAEYAELLASQFDSRAPMGARQMISLDVDLVITSCGYGVPVMDYRAERDSMDRWAEKQGADGLVAYQHEHNTMSMDGLPSGLFENEPAE